MAIELELLKGIHFFSGLSPNELDSINAVSTFGLLTGTHHILE